MKKQNILWIVLDAIFLVIFNVIFFLIGGTERANAAVWISYVFIHISYAMLIITPFLVRKGKSAAAFGFSIYSISSAYFITQFLVGIFFILWAPETMNIAFVIQLILAGFYGIILVANLILNEKIADVEEVRAVEIAYVRRATKKLELLLEGVKDKEAKKFVEKAYDEVSASPIKSHPNVAQTEQNILLWIDALENEIYGGDIEKIISMAKNLVIQVENRNNELEACR
ncbi:MAG: hypothetical protein LBC86_02335 [Oscillospiraceae bacterium]|jgi:membrane-associated HD superfamily phosphohydrolase|nr:hypothetical protein [Oscillospiraceae bacterium]